MPKSDMMIERKQKYEISLKWLSYALPLLPTSTNTQPPNAAKRKCLHNYYSFFFFPFIVYYVQSQLLPVLALI